MLEAARQFHISKIVYAASSSCYGMANIFPTPEDAPIMPEYPYALTKRMGEELVSHWNKVYGLPFVSLRFLTFTELAQELQAHMALSLAYF